jgi:hypothetical protein
MDDNLLISYTSTFGLVYILHYCSNISHARLGYWLKIYDLNDNDRYDTIYWCFR